MTQNNYSYVLAHPTVTPFGVWFSSTFKKYKKARYGKREAPKNGPANASDVSRVIISGLFGDRDSDKLLVIDVVASTNVVVVVAVAVVAASKIMDGDKFNADDFLLIL